MSNDLITTELTFEDFKKENGMIYWLATDLMKMLGYENFSGFKKAIERAIKACMSLSIPFEEHFLNIENKNYKLTRFACYLTAMNGDTKKKEVALAQAYFVHQTRELELYLQGTNEIDRLLIRDELKEGNKLLSSAAKGAGVTDYARFQNAGYLGLYNQNIWQVRKMKGLAEKADISDYMGRTELAANLFRVTMTEEKLKKDKIFGQYAAENTHQAVAQQVRKMVIENVGTPPEALPIENKLIEVKKELKKGAKKLTELDKK